MVYKLVMYFINIAISLLDRRPRLKMQTINVTFDMHAFLEDFSPSRENRVRRTLTQMSLDWFTNNASLLSE